LQKFLEIPVGSFFWEGGGDRGSQFEILEQVEKRKIAGKIKVGVSKFYC